MFIRKLSSGGEDAYAPDRVSFSPGMSPEVRDVSKESRMSPCGLTLRRSQLSLERVKGVCHIDDA